MGNCIQFDIKNFLRHVVTKSCKQLAEAGNVRSESLSLPRLSTLAHANYLVNCYRAWGFTWITFVGETLNDPFFASEQSAVRQLDFNEWRLTEVWQRSPIDEWFISLSRAFYAIGSRLLQHLRMSHYPGGSCAAIDDWSKPISKHFAIFSPSRFPRTERRH